jgi:hypothetical protein
MASLTACSTPGVFPAEVSCLHPHSDSKSAKTAITNLLPLQLIFGLQNLRIASALIGRTSLTVGTPPMSLLFA